MFYIENIIEKVVCLLFYVYIFDFITDSLLTYSLSPFFLITFSTLNSFDLLFAILFQKRSNNFIAFKITNNISPRNSIFNFCNNKDFFRPIWNIAFCKNGFTF